MTRQFSALTSTTAETESTGEKSDESTSAEQILSVEEEPKKKKKGGCIVC